MSECKNTPQSFIKKAKIYYMGLIEGRWAFITGSSRGIGQQIALGLAKHKVNLIVHGRNEESVAETLQLLKDFEIETKHVHGELNTPQGVNSVIDQVTQLNLHVDILYNNAAISCASKSLYDFEQSEWEEVFQVNVWAPIALCKAFVPAMKRRGWGRVVNLTSGIREQPNLAPYGVSKGTIDRYTQDLSWDLRGSGVLANYLDPGWLRTKMGGTGAMYDVEDVLPGALIPVLLEDDGPSGQLFAAMDYRSK
jgi:NAD(P)-dependent dehydrogenase (short-subunit alcohol dehydrogenase family)